MSNNQFGEGGHHASLQLLQDVEAYLRRLPPHPMHRELADRISGHLQQPPQRAAAAEPDLAGETYSAAGIPLFAARLKGDVLRMCLLRVNADAVVSASGATAKDEVLSALLRPNGLALEMRPPIEPPLPWYVRPWNDYEALPESHERACAEKLPED